MKRYVVGISGASGCILSIKLIRALLDLNFAVDVIITPSGMKTLYYEMHVDKGGKGFLSLFTDEQQQNIKIHLCNALDSCLASGSSEVMATVIIPCSMATVAAISIGLGDNLLRRAADVSIKERKPLLIVPREAPLSAIHLENLLKLSQLGVIIFPPTPLWYFNPKNIDELENTLVGKILNSIGVENSLAKVWREGS